MVFSKRFGLLTVCSFRLGSSGWGNEKVNSSLLFLNVGTKVVISSSLEEEKQVKIDTNNCFCIVYLILFSKTGFDSGISLGGPFPTKKSTLNIHLRHFLGIGMTEA